MFVIKKTFKGSIKSTGAVCNGALLACLGVEGYEVSFGKTYIEAFGADNNLVIFPVNRCLSDKQQAETTLVAATEVGVRKFLEHYYIDSDLLDMTDVSAEDFYTIIDDVSTVAIPCIAYCVCKYTYADIEICVVPISVIKEKAQRGGVFSISQKTGNLNYDFSKIGEMEILEGVILRKSIKMSK